MLNNLNIRRTAPLSDAAAFPLNTPEGLRHHFVDPDKAQALASLVEQLHDKKALTNIAQVRQLSPFRYPGGKTWLVPEVRK